MEELVKGATAAAPNVLSLALFMRYIRRWAISEVVTPKQPAERALVINHLVKILNFSVDVRNFEVAMAILEALKYVHAQASRAHRHISEVLACACPSRQDSRRGAAPDHVELRATQDAAGQQTRTSARHARAT